MNIQDLGIFKIAGQQMSWLGARQAVLAQNVANVNTPDYTPRDLDELDFSKVIRQTQGTLGTDGQQMTTTNSVHLNGNSRGVSLIRTNPMHLNVPSLGSGRYGAHKVKLSYETSLDKNGVIVEDEMAKMDSTRSAYNLVASIYQKNIGLINLALGTSS